MHTQLLPADQHSIKLAADLLRKGQVVAFPTETVYGLGAHALDAQAVAGIFDAKGRPADNPLIVHVRGKEEAAALCHWSDRAEALALAFWPGPLTLILPRRGMVPDIVTAGLDTVGLRAPSHPVAQALLSAAGLPIAAPSANRSGKPSPTTAQHVLEDLEGRIPMILDGGSSDLGLESTVLDLTGPVPLILRPGAVTPEQVAMVLGACDVSPLVMRQLQPGETAASPGLRHRHYAPQARLSLVTGEDKAVADFINRQLAQEPNAHVMALSDHLVLYPPQRRHDMGRDAFEAAHRLFYLLRGFDELGVGRVYSETLPADGLGLAVMNRLARAAQFDVIQAGVD